MNEILQQQKVAILFMDTFDLETMNYKDIAYVLTPPASGTDGQHDRFCPRAYLSAY